MPALSLAVTLLLAGACGSGATIATGTALPAATTAPSTSAAAPAVVTATMTTVAPAGPAASAASSPGATPGAQTSVAGAVTYVIDAGQSSASYTVREQLARLSFPSDAVGKTSKITGQVVLDAAGKIDPAGSKITVDLSTLTSDQSMRDNYIKQSTLETRRYPDAVFVPTGASGLPWPLPTSGDFSFQLTGDLTVHGVTKSTTWAVKATATPQGVKGTATTSATFEDFGMTPPKTLSVLSVQDHIGLALDFLLTRQ